MRYVLVLIAALVVSMAQAKEIRWEQRCENGVCRMVAVVHESGEPPAAKLPRANGPTVAVPPQVVRFATFQKLTVRLRTAQPLRALASRLSLRTLLRFRCH